MKLSVKHVVAIGIGTAIFVILGRFVVIPTGIPNTNIETTYPFLALFSILYGPVVGFLVGFLGHTLTDFTLSGSPWWSWVLCSALVGLVFGWLGKFLKVQEGEFGLKGGLIFNLGQIVTNLLVWGLVAPTLDIVIYSEPANKVYLQGIVAGISNSVSVAILGTILIKSYAATRVKKGSLSRE